MLLTRDKFREQVFARDGGICVFCDKPAKDAHHIIERKLWADGGYYLNNGASVCADHHIMCETTELSVEDVRVACGITKIIVPEHMYDDHSYDKWGNIILSNGQRTKGELFDDDSVQKILGQGGMLGVFTDYVKYPRTFHVTWSECVHSDDKILPTMNQFAGKRVVVTEKMDGENSSLYRDYYHARSIDSANHPSRNRAKAIHANISHEIPVGWRLCCENMFAKHSIEYTDLEGYLYGFSIWDARNECLSWDDTVEWFTLLGIPVVKVLYDGIYDEAVIRKLYDSKADWDKSEGYVIRVADGFPYGAFRKSVAKFVRPNHVQTIKHWMHGQPITPNKLKS